MTEIIREDLGTTTMKQVIEIEGITYSIYGNRRKGENDFTAYYFCNICDSQEDKFAPKLIQIPNTKLKICRTCINNMETALRTATYSDCINQRS